MKEQLVSFETAKLALEKGYVGKIGLGYKYNAGNYYNFKGELNGDCTDLVREIHKTRNSEVKPQNTNISAPTQSLLQKWLREFHNLDVNVITKHKDLGKFYGGFIDTNNDNINKSYGSNYKTYEEALENGLKEALNFIIL